MSQSSNWSPHTLLARRVIEAVTNFHGLGYAEVDSNLTIRRVSANFGALLQLDDPEIEEQGLTDVLWEFVGSEPTLQRILAGEVPLYIIEQVNRDARDGGIIYFNYQVIPLQEASPGEGLLLIIEDATLRCEMEQRLVQDRNELWLLQQKLAEANEELTRLSRFKSFLISMAAHDLRSSLSAISGYAELLLDDLEELTIDEQREFTSIIRAQSYQLSRLLSSMLDLDQIEQGRLIMKQEPCNLNAVVYEVVGTMEPSALLQEIELEVDLPSPPLRVLADSDRLLQIVHNLVSNAIKYTPSGGQIRVVLGDSASGDGEVVLRVEDTGYGLTEEQQRDLFKLYYRTDEARKSKIRGTGLGLFIVRTLVEAHQGRVTVESEPGKGSIFSVFLPVARLTEPVTEEAAVQ